MRDSWESELFLGHSDSCDQEAEVLGLDWDEYADVAVRVQLLDRWLYEDSPDAPAILTDLRTDQQDTGVTPEALTKNGLFRVIAPQSRMRREPRDYRVLTVPEAASIVERALLDWGGTPSQRVVLLAADLRETIISEGQEAVLVTVADPVTNTVMEDETHVVVSGMAWAAPVIRISVVPRPEGGELLDPACSFAACSSGVRLTPEEHGLAEARLRAICAGTVLAALLECDGRAAFKVGWQAHGIDPGHHCDLVTVRAWWETTAWHDQYYDDHIDVYYDYGAGDWGGRHAHLFPGPEQLDDEFDGDAPGQHCLVLGDPAEPTTDIWVVGDGMRPLDTTTFLAEIEALRRAGRDQTTAGQLVDFLLDELLTRPLERVGGPEHRMVVWADADGTGTFWRTDEEIDVYDDARRLLVVGPSEALYIVFRGEMGA
ncbi:hypothetical protein ACWDSD_41040 [Streptomyces spiralis]